MKQFTLAAVVLAAFTGAGTAALGCEVPHVMSDRDYRLADAVFVGELRDFVWDPETWTATLTFDVLETFTGPAQTEWVIKWFTQDPKPDWDGPSRLIVGAVDLGALPPFYSQEAISFRGLSGYGPDAEGWAVVQMICGFDEAFLLSDTPANRLKVLNAMGLGPQ